MAEPKNSGWLLSASWSVSQFWGIHTRNLSSHSHFLQFLLEKHIKIQRSINLFLCYETCLESV